jgi:hypothetical protein
MKKTRFTKPQIVPILKEADAGMKVADKQDVNCCPMGRRVLLSSTRLNRHHLQLHRTSGCTCVQYLCLSACFIKNELQS